MAGSAAAVVTWPERIWRVMPVMLLFALLAWLTSPIVADYVWGLVGKRSGPGALVIGLILGLLLAICAAVVELSFSRREYAANPVARVRRRHHQYTAIVAWVGVVALLLGPTMVVWYILATRSMREITHWQSIKSVLPLLEIGAFGIICAAILAGIANRLAFCALERRRAGRD